MRIRVASYNIRKAIGRDARRDPDRILDLVTQLGAEIVALQEADYRFKGRAPIFDADHIRDRTGLVPLPLPHWEPGLGWHGNVLLVRPEFAIGRTECLELPGLEPRGAIVADLLIGDRPVRVLAAHLGLLARYRIAQSREMLKAADLRPERATIVMGDFNGWGRTPNSLSLFGLAMTRVPTGRSYPSRVPLTPLDRIYYDGAIALGDCGVYSDATARIASDHLPIWAELELIDARSDGRARKDGTAVGSDPNATRATP